MSFLFNNSSILNNSNKWTGKNIYNKYLPCSKLLPESKYDFVNKKYIDCQNKKILNLSKLYTNTKCEETLKESEEFTKELVTNTNLNLGNLIISSTQYVLKFFPITTNVGIGSSGNYNITENLYLLYTKSVNLSNDNYIYTGFTPQLENISGGGTGSLPNAVIKSIVFDSMCNLYLAGDINKIGSLSYNNIVKWDGNNFSSLGKGLNGQVITMYIDSQDNLYVGGSFSEAGGITCNNIAMWDGTNWNTLGNPLNPGLNSNVYSIVTGPNNSIYIGGDFSSTFDSLITLNYVTLWNGTAFSALGSGLPNSVYALASDSDSDSDLYAGGFNIPVSGWDGINWTILQDLSGNILEQIVNTMQIGPDSNLYIGGTIGTTGSFNIPNTNNLVKFIFDTNTWVPINNSSGAGLDSQCYNLIFGPDGNLYLGGFFSNLTDDSLVLNGVAKYILATSTFVALGDGITGGGVESLRISPLDSSIWIGGNFYQASNQYIYGITNYTNNFINLIWNTNNMGTLTNLNPSTIVYTNNNELTSKYIGFNQNPTNLISNY